ncbi:phosphatase PAP2 family protein [Ilumatobacter nonamiensis]|uniref:phosphatase PAP2 family protein n=1 Tax=Ilumatobacter nonamiensis TaxID=467093 RepID=UPI00034AE7F4|nr:phosphatase PAP2 family protein [Ilumatobacter nonamiensis]
MSDDLRPDDVPGQHDLGPAVEHFDEVVDEQLERVRGNAVLDRVFTTASHVGDFSLIWHSINLALGIRNRNPRRIVMFASLIGLESLIVNQGIKRIFKRSRPTLTGEDGLEVRTPLTSSFPSGHASSATFAAVLLAHRTRNPVAALIYTAAFTVATSRAYVRIHHASDVVAGVVTGGLLAAIARRLIRRAGADDLL